MSRNRRAEPRIIGFKGKVSFLLAGGDLHHGVPIKALDVSRRGLGFLIDRHLPSATEYILIIDSHQFRVETTYCDSELGLDNRFRVGIFVRDADVNLVETCVNLGFLELTEEEEP